MNILEALNQIIDKGIEAVKRDYKEGTDKYNGSIAGFEECRNKNPGELANLLIKSRQDTQKAFLRASKDITEGYWFVRCFELEVEWVCNVLSAILQNNHLPVIVVPTCRGIMTAAEIIGVRK
jgi:hypothetical protein